MSTLVRTFLAFLTACFRSHAALQMKNAMLRHQLDVYKWCQLQLEAFSVRFEVNHDVGVNDSSGSISA